MNTESSDRTQLRTSNATPHIDVYNQLKRSEYASCHSESEPSLHGCGIFSRANQAVPAPASTEQ